MTTIEKPIVSPIPFYPEEENIDPRYNMRHMLSTLHFLTLREFEEQVRYLQKWQYEHIELQFHTLATGTTPTLYLVDPNLNTVHSWGPMPGIVLTGNVDPYSGAQLYTWHFRFTLAGIGLSEGIYFFRFKAPFASGDKYQISEPQAIRAKHPGTVLLQYSNDTNDYNAVFEQSAAQLVLRVEGDVKYIEPDASFESFTNIDRRKTKTYGKQGRKFQFDVGGNARRPGRGVPDWMFDKLDAITILDHWRADGKEFVRSGDKWNKQQMEGHPMMRGSIVVEEANPDESTFSTTLPPVVLIIIPGSVFALSSVKIGVSVPNIELLPVLRVVDPATGIVALITDLNAQASAMGLGGTVSQDGGNIIYTPADGEFYAVSSRDMYFSVITFTLQGQTIPFLSTIGLQGASAVIDWDGNLQLVSAAPGPVISRSHLFSGTSTKTVRVFHNGIMDGFYNSDVRRRSFGGTLPANLVTLFLNNGTYAANTLDLTILTPCTSSIQSLTVTNGALTSTPNFNSIYCPNLKTINFSGNSFNQTGVGNFIYDVYFNSSNHLAGSPVTSGGVLSLTNQNPSANPLNPKGITNMALLKAPPYNWKVNV